VSFSLNASARLTPVFEEDAASWEEKLNRIHVLFGEITVGRAGCSLIRRCLD
jgi:hypothetical protein